MKYSNASRQGIRRVVTVVAASKIERLFKYVKNTPADEIRSAASVKNINKLIDKNKGLY